MKTTKELLILVKALYIMKMYSGFCSVTIDLWADGVISWDERLNLQDYIKKYAPSHKSSMDNKHFPYAWKPYARDCRIEWLDKHIKETEL